MFDIFYINNKPNINFAKKVKSISDAILLSRTRYLWIVDGANDYSTFDFTFEPVPWESQQMHVWESQWQENGGTHLIAKEHSSETNYKNEVIERNKVTVPFIFLDFDNADSIEAFTHISSVSNDVTKTRFISSYHGTLSRIISKVDSEYVWVTSSMCDYSSFDFTWHPSEWQSEMLHVFPSNEQKFGDTFYIHVPTFKEQVNAIALLEWYDTINFVSNISVPRWDIPTVKFNSDDLVSVIKQHAFNDPFVEFRHVSSAPTYTVPCTIPMWREKTRTVISLSDGNSASIIPRDAKNHIINQVYDYPYVSLEFVSNADTQQDIIFISYDEINAEQNWQILHERFPRAKHVRGIKGMDNALKEAAIVSDTEWYYAVFAKTQVHNDFDFSFMPDRFQQPKHYIFNSLNILNDLVYGHMGIVLYNCNIILGMDNDFGIDYTLSAEHESIPLLSAVATFNASEYQTWRTAFRECAKLSQFNSESPSVDGEYRLNVWKTKAEGNYASWCLKGANDGVDYFNANASNACELKKAFNWEWLREYFVSKYGNIN
jgi:hypothetical protein